ncbi:hypothetical protein NDU88_005516 [Pleurodeles waltl]|uniref:Uncharacterized protein n=1 Tax=Pleurodeles waltl TaxID=8319 RepID=A0AAV7VJ80_PLEWA|nr:hypothetical protein NDU88_005516 [Pleurodeles waltl]
MRVSFLTELSELRSGEWKHCWDIGRRTSEYRLAAEQGPVGDTIGCGLRGRAQHPCISSSRTYSHGARTPTAARPLTPALLGGGLGLCWDSTPGLHWVGLGTWEPFRRGS